MDNLHEFFRVSERLLPHVAELLAEFSDLGSNPRIVVDMLRRHGLPSGARILDLGCGKGAVSVAAARELGTSVTGVDAYAPFIEAAKAAAEEAGVGARCRFEQGDLRDVLRGCAGSGAGVAWDAALFVSVGCLLGDPGMCVEALRRCVRPGGLLVVDECHRLGVPVDVPGYEDLPTREELLGRISLPGVELVEARDTSFEEMRAMNELYTERILRSARALAARRPDLAEDIKAYVATEHAECAALETGVRCVTFCLRRTE